MATEYGIVQEQLDRYTYCRDNGHTEYSAKAAVCEAFFAGEQWDEDAKAKLRRQRRPALTFNKVLPSCASIFGEQLTNKADIGFKPVKGGAQETADALHKVFIQIGNANMLGWKESELFADGIITSRAFYDVRMNFDNNIFGEVEIDLLNPRNVVLDPDSEEYDPKKWKDCFTSKWLNLSDIDRLYGKAAKKELEGQKSSDRYLGYDFIDLRPDTFGGSIHRFGAEDSGIGRFYRQLERQHKTLRMQDHFVDMVTGDTRVIPDGMPREKIQLILKEFDVSVIKRKTEVIQWTVTINETVVHNEESPYTEFTVVPFFPFFRRGKTIGIVENLIDPQELYNKVRSQELHIVNTTANSGWKVKTGALQNMDVEDLQERGSETGLVVELNDMDGLDKITPNTVPTGLDRISYIAQEDLKEISMASDSMRGFDRADVAAKAIMAKQAQGSTNYTKIFDNLSYTRMLLAKRVLDLVQTFYVEERIVHITGNEPGAQDEQIVINEITPEGRIARDMTVGKYEVTVSTVPARETFEETQFQQAVALRELGIQIPDEILIENSHLARKHEIAQQLAGGPSEEELQAQRELAAIELQAKQLENAKMAAEQKRIEAETALTLIRAQAEALKDPNGSESQDKSDMIKLAQAEADKEKELADLSLRKYEIDKNLEVEYEKLRLKELEIRENARAQAQQAKLKLVQSEPKPKPKKEGSNNG